MPIVNPYAKKKKAIQVPQKPAPKAIAAATTPVVKKTAAPPTTKTPTSVSPPNNGAPKKIRPVVPKTPATTTTRLVTPSAKTVVANKKKPASFKTQLKQQIQELKRQKKLAHERKLMEKRLKEREAEQKRQEEERKKIYLEFQKKREEERQRKEEERKQKEAERIRIQAEKQKQREIKAAERLVKDQEKELVRAEKERIRVEKERTRAEKQRQQELAYQQRMLAYQQRQMLQYGYVPHVLPPYSAMSLSYQHQGMPAPPLQSVPHAQTPSAPPPLQPVPQAQTPHNPLPVPPLQPVPQTQTPHNAPPVSPIQPVPQTQTQHNAPTVPPLQPTPHDQTQHNTSACTAPQGIALLQTPLIPSPPREQQGVPTMAHPSVSAPMHHDGSMASHSMFPYAPSRGIAPPMFNHAPGGTPMFNYPAACMPMTGFGAPPPPYQRAATLMPRYKFPVAPQQRPAPPPKILSRKPLEPPSPFSETFEILEQSFVIYKAAGANFGVSVEIQSQSVLVDPDVWDALHNCKTPADSGKQVATTTTSTVPTGSPTLLKGATVPNDRKVIVADSKVKVPETTTMQGNPLTSSESLPKPDASSASADVKVTRPDNNLASGESGSESSIGQVRDTGDASAKKDDTACPTAASTESAVLEPTQTEASSSLSPDHGASSLLVREEQATVGAINVEGIVKEKPSEDTSTLTPKPEDGAIVAVKSSPTAASEKTPSTTVLPPSNVSSLSVDQKPRRRRRKRAFFHAMSVMDASKQNEKYHATVDPEKKLKQGDLILEINGATTSDLPFYKACQLFTACKPTTESDNQETALFKCTLLVARRKSKPLPPPQKIAEKLPSPKRPPVTHLSLNNKTNLIVAGEFTANEMVELARGVSTGLVDSLRPLGYKATAQVLSKCTSVGLIARDHASIHRKLSNLNGSIDAAALSVATSHWRQDWSASHSDVKIPDALKLDFLTPAQLAAIRALPRPLRGCRCGSTDHEYVNHPQCILYHHLCKLTGKSPDQVAPVKSTQLATTLKDLSAVESAFKDRVVRGRTEEELELAEAKFVNEMEKLQVRNIKRSIFAPNFTVMVICAIAELGSKFDETVTPVSEEERTADVPVADTAMEEEDNNEEDDDDLPLFSLGKRPAEGASGSAAAKKTKQDIVSQQFHPAFLARLLMYFSQTWGHVYRESSHGDYTWRWEVHHGQTSEEKREGCKNPRTPGTLSLANVEFAMQDEFLERIQSVPFGKMPSFHNDDDAKKKQWADDMLRIAYLVSPERTGLLDELLALEQVGIVRKSKQGAAVLNKDWFTRVDPLVLEDMDSKWSYEADPDNKYLIHGKVKRDLANYWMRVDGAWALNEDLSELVFLDDEWDEWRRSFEDEIGKRADNEDGIGKFGI